VQHIFAVMCYRQLIEMMLIDIYLFNF